MEILKVLGTLLIIVIVLMVIYSFKDLFGINNKQKESKLLNYENKEEIKRENKT